jgi:hypothetical protein
MIADITASILLEQPLPRSTEKLDALYDENTNEFCQIENALAIYGADKLEEDIVKTFSILGETIDSYSLDTKCLLNIDSPSLRHLNLSKSNSLALYLLCKLHCNG